MQQLQQQNRNHPETLPKVLLISDLSLAKSQDGKSSNPTLYNLFKEYPPELIIQLFPKTTLKYSPPAAPHQQAISYQDSFIPTLRNRIGLITNSWANFLNLSILNVLPPPHQDAIRQFEPHLLLICPITLSNLILGMKIANILNYPYLIYFMDDWLAVNHDRWLCGNTQSLACAALNQATGWLMISDYLQQELCQRYRIKNKPCLVAHNPVNQVIVQGTEKINAPQKFRIAYAGSVQTMHADALFAIAEAVFHLRQQGEQIELMLYTAPAFWQVYQDTWTQFEVQYGSLIPYDELQQTLSEADLLLVCTAFSPDARHIVRSSLLTKLTDYMAVGKPILSCGPSYSACNQFLEKWNCGVICPSQSIPEILTLLKQCMTGRQTLAELADRAKAVLEENFSEQVVRKRFHTFIKTIHLQSHPEPMDVFNLSLRDDELV